MDKMLTMLEKEKVKKYTIERGLSVFACCKSQKVEDFITKLKNHQVNIPEAMDKNLTTIRDANIDEMDGILDILTELGMSLEENISIVRYTTTARLNEIVGTMRKNGVNDERIAKHLKGIVVDDGKLGIKIEDTFESRRLENRKVQIKNARKFMKLAGMFGRYYEREELEQFCAEKNITVREFVEGIVCGNMSNKDNGIADIYYNRIMEGKSLYVGPPKPIDHEYLEEHAEEILELSRIAARKFLITRQKPYIDELSGLALEIIMDKCGNLVENLQGNTNALRGSIVNRASRYLYSVVEQNRTVSITQRFSNDEGKVTVKDNDYSFDLNGEGAYEGYEKPGLREAVNFKRAEFNSAEEEVMECMIRLIEEGEADDLYTKIAQIVDVDESEVMEIIYDIREKMVDSKLVRENTRRGGYEFSYKYADKEEDIEWNT